MLGKTPRNDLKKSNNTEIEIVLLKKTITKFVISRNNILCALVRNINFQCICSI